MILEDLFNELFASEFYELEEKQKQEILALLVEKVELYCGKIKIYLRMHKKNIPTNFTFEVKRRNEPFTLKKAVQLLFPVAKRIPQKRQAKKLIVEG